MDATQGLAAILRDGASRLLRMRSSRRAQGRAPPAITAKPLRRDEAGVYFTRAASARLRSGRGAARGRAVARVFRRALPSARRWGSRGRRGEYRTEWRSGCGNKKFEKKK